MWLIAPVEKRTVDHILEDLQEEPNPGENYDSAAELRSLLDLRSGSYFDADNEWPTIPQCLTEADEVDWAALADEVDEANQLFVLPPRQHRDEEFHLDKEQLITVASQQENIDWSRVCS